MTLGPLMIDVEGLQLTPADRDILRRPAVGGVILFSRNYENPEQLEALVAEIHALRQPRLLIAVDQEGGRVQRFRESFSQLPAMREFGRRYAQDSDAALALTREAGWLLAAELRSVGIDLSFAPVVDLDRGLSSVIGDRAFASDPDVVAALALALMRGMQDAGMVAVAKHFPGHGGVVADSHLDLPVDRRDFGELLDDIRPFERLVDANIAAVMTAHVVYEQFDALPASFSQWWLQEQLRGRLGFNGTIFSDDLSMQATVSYGGIEERVQLALAAGCDMLLVCNDRDAAERAVATLGNFSQEPASSLRLARLRGGETVRRQELQDSEKYQHVTARIDAVTRPPPLSLDA